MTPADAVRTGRRRPLAAAPPRGKGQAFGSERNERRRVAEASRRARILAALKRLVSDLESDRAAWARVETERTLMTASGSGEVSMEDALLYFTEGSDVEWLVPVDRDVWVRLTARAEQLSQDTGRQWTAADIVELVGEAAEARLRQDPEGTLAWVRSRRRTLKPGARYEVPFDTGVASAMQDFADGADVGDAPGVVLAHLRDAAFVEDVLAVLQ